MKGVAHFRKRLRAGAFSSGSQKVHDLNGLSEGDMFALLQRLAQAEGAKQVERILQDNPGRVRALRVLTGGNPRTLMLLYRVLSQGPDGDVQRDIEQLLDLYTPLYKARFEEMAPQAQQVMDAMAINWDPVTAGDLAGKLAPLSVNQVSAQLKRLEDFGVVEKTPWFGEKKAGFQIAERFFNIWYLMRASRRVRRRLIWLVKFLEAWFEREELSERAHAMSGQWAPAGALLEVLATGETDEPDMWTIRAAVSAGLVDGLIDLFERTGASDRWRPIYQALRAIQAGSAQYLRRVAPEVRAVAREIVQEIAPSMAN